MAMPPYPIYCYSKDCKNLAEYKIAARWSDGIVSELKTYGLCCHDCAPAWLRRSRAKQQATRRAPGETLEPCGIFRLAHGSRDQQLTRLEELEQTILAQPARA
jgi:hypothetical protein